MFSGLLRLTWLEIKIFLREPLGVLGTILIPVLVFALLGRGLARGGQAQANSFYQSGLPVLVAMMVAISAALSLVAIISIYREGGILKRLRATPLSPVTILSAHVIVKMLFSMMTLILLFLAGRRFYVGAMTPTPIRFVAALLLASLAVLTMGFVIASLVPTARFAQPLGSLLFYPLLGLAFVPTTVLSTPLAALSRISPVTHAVQLLRAAWAGAGWVEHWVNVVALIVSILVALALTQRVFRWE